jgi:hypothetical protein
MKIPFTLVLLLGTLTVLSQNNSENIDKWKVGVTFSPDYYITSSNISLTQETGYGSVDPSRFNFTSGLSAEWSFNSHFEIGSGINYSRKDLSTIYYCNVCNYEFWYPYKESVKLRFIEIPVFIRYKILDKKVDLHVEAGLTSGYLPKEFRIYGGPVPTNRFQFGGQVGLGLNLDLGQRITLSFSSDFKQSFTNLLVDSNFKFRSIGLSTGIMYKIN